MDSLLFVNSIIASLADLVASAVQLDFILSPLLGKTPGFHFGAQLADPTAGEFRGAVGNVVAAYLQTKGLIDQAKILSDFKTSLDTIAALFWLFSIALAVGSVAVFGNYRQGIYLLLGPTFFFFMIQETAGTNGTQLRFGDFVKENSEEEQHEMLDWIRAIDPEDKNKEVQVSRFFATWDAITTEATQSVVSLLLKTAEKEHLLMIARERMLNFLLHSSSDHPGMIRLIGAVFRGECGQSIPDIQRAHQLMTNPPVEVYDKGSQKVAETRFKSKWDKDPHSIDTLSKGFLISMRDGGVEGFQSPALKNLKDPSQNFNATCEEIWGYVWHAAKFVAKRRATVENFMQVYQVIDAGDQPLQEALDDARLYLAQKKTGVVLDEDKVYDRLAVQVLKNSSDRTTFGALTSQVFGRTPFNSSDHEEISQLIAKAEGHSGFMKIQYFANAVPYVQGLLLYVLSIAFPFFAIFLVIPSRATTFFAWMGMWAWVKSWDVGFAAVHVARKVMWDMMSRRNNIFDTEIDGSDPVTVIATMFNNDPFTSQNAYFMVISTLTLAVPFITAHFFLGATGLFDMFSGTIDQTADNFGSVAENKRSRRFIANVNERIQRLDRFNTQMVAMKSALNQPSYDGTDNHGQNAGSRQRDGDSGQLARAQGTDSNHEGAATMSGRPIVDAQHADSGGEGISIARARNAAAHFVAADIYSQIGNKSFTNGLVSERAAARNSDHSHITRGMVPFTQEVTMQELKDLYGDNEVAQKLHDEKTTWGDVYHMSSQFQIDNQALTAAETGRRMMNPARIKGGAAGLLNLRMGQDEFMRSNQAALDVATVPGMDRLLGDLDIDKPNTNSDSFFNVTPKKK